MADVELDDLRDRIQRADVGVVESVTGEDFQVLTPCSGSRFGDSREFGGRIGR